MRIRGFAGYNWSDTSLNGPSTDSFWFGIKEDATLINSVEPVIHLRPGTTPTFGIPQVGSMNIPGEFGYRAVASDRWGGDPEVALLWLMQRIDPFFPTPRTLKAIRRALLTIEVSIPAILALPTVSSTKQRAILDATFVTCDPAWVGTTISNSAGFA
jgi:hypothetical protein